MAASPNVSCVRYLIFIDVRNACRQSKRNEGRSDSDYLGRPVGFNIQLLITANGFSSVLNRNLIKIIIYDEGKCISI